MEEKEKIGEVATDYFISLFQSSHPNHSAINRVLEGVSQKISDDQRNALDKKFSRAEIELALRDMHPSKAPGPNGAQAMFYQTYWGIVGEETTKVYLEILNEKGDTRHINKTLITLIPKLHSPKRMSDFRPISLCNVVYKLIAKVLANRMKKVLDTIISPSQSAFVPGRQISDNVIVGFECIHALNRKSRGSSGLIATKLDMSKACDRVEWSFLRGMMARMGFSSNWIDLVMGCVESVEFSVLVNGSPQRCFNPSRGIRQGDPLSPYLFLLCAEGLSSLLSKEEQANNLQGIRINNYCPSITHLFFADDSLIFCRASEKDCWSLKGCLKAYEDASGQPINLHKSVFMASKNVGGVATKKLRQILEIKDESSIGDYLGMPSQNGRSKAKLFKRLSDKIGKALMGWKESLFSAGGKEILIKAIIQAIPTYTMSCFRLPKFICEEINKRCARFWWGATNGERKIHWKSWKSLCKSKDFGGMGFREISLFNQAMLAKQSWRLIRNPDSLLFKVLRGRYFRNESFLKAPIGSNPSLAWRSIVWGRDLFIKGYCWKVGNDSYIYIDQDP